LGSAGREHDVGARRRLAGAAATGRPDGPGALVFVVGDGQAQALGAYRRQAWFCADPLRIGPNVEEGRETEWPYEGDWRTDARKIGVENYYPPLDM
jgi:hypothetical protein